MGQFGASLWKDLIVRFSSKKTTFTQLFRYSLVFGIVVLINSFSSFIAVMFLWMLLPLSIMMAGRTTAVEIVTEKQSGLRNFLKIHGLNDLTSNATRVLTDAVNGFGVALFGIIIFKFADFLSFEEYWKLTISITLFFSATAAMTCLLTIPLNTPITAGVAVVWINFGALLIYQALDDYEIIQDFLLQVFPLASFGQALFRAVPMPAPDFYSYSKVLTGGSIIRLKEVTIQNTATEYWEANFTMMWQIPAYLLLATYGTSMFSMLKKRIRKKRTRSDLLQPLLSESVDSNVAVSVRGAHKTYGKLEAVKHVDLDIPKNQVFCLLGQNGAGKTTLLNMITGFAEGDRGTFQINKNGNGWSDIAVGDFGYCPQIDIKVEGFTVYQHVKLMAKLRGQPSDSIMATLQRLRLEDKRDSTFMELSGGMKRRLTIAMAEVGYPPILVLDEPTSGLDPKTKGHLLQDLRIACQNKTAILTTHNMEEAEQLGVKISVMHHGEISHYPNAEALKRECDHCHFIEFSPEAADVIRGVIEEELPGTNFDQTAQKGKFPLSSTISPSKLEKIFKTIEQRQPNGDYSFDSLSLQEAFVELHRKKEARSEETTIGKAKVFTLDSANSAMDVLSKLRVEHNNARSRQFFMIVGIKFREIIRRFSSILAFFAIPALGILDIALRRESPLIDTDFLVFSYNSVWVLMATLMIASAGQIIVTHKARKLRFWLRVNGTDIRVYWFTTILWEWSLYCVRLLIFAAGVLYFKGDIESYTTMLWNVLPLYLMTGLPLYSGIFLITKDWTKETNAGKIVFSLVYFIAYFGFEVIHLLVKDQAENFNTLICVISVLNPIWTAIFAPVYDTVIGKKLFLANPVVTSVNEAIYIQAALGLVFSLLLIFREDKIRETNNKLPDLRNTKADIETSHVEKPELRANKCSKSFSGKTVVNHLDLSLENQNIQGLIGPNGAGKSTSFNLLTLEIAAEGGKLNYWNPKITIDMFMEMGLCAQEMTLWDHFTLQDHFDIVCGIKGLTLTTQEMAILLEVFTIEKTLNTRTRELSGGNKRKFLVLLCLLGNPRVKLLDEPTTGVDPLSRHAIWKMIENQKTKGSTLLSTHSMEEAEVLCDKIAIMAAGNLINNNTPNQLRKEFENSYQLLVSSVSVEDAINLRSALLETFPGCQEEPRYDDLTMVFNIPRGNQFHLSKLFHLLQQKRVHSWGLKKSSFQTVFMSLLSQYEGNDEHTIRI